MRVVIPIVLFGLAAWFLVDTDSGLPAAERAEVAPEQIAFAPPRTLREDLTVIEIGGTELRCSDCHMLFESPPVTYRTLRQHGHVALRHGLNDRCLNCHARSDRNKLELHDGSLVGFEQTEQLCAKCHGPTFRDWERGIHGRTSGSWDVRSDAHRRLSCIECHDPHAPAFEGIAPLPGPNTWRSGAHAAAADADHGGTTSPLGRRATEPFVAPRLAPHLERSHDAPTEEERDG